MSEARYRKEVPEFDQMVRAVTTLRRSWSADGAWPPHLVAYYDPDTGQVSFILRGGMAQLQDLADRLGIDL